MTNTLLSAKMEQVQFAEPEGGVLHHGKAGELTFVMVRWVLTEEKPKEWKVALKADKISEYFTENCSSGEIEGIIIQLLDEWKKRQ